MAMKITLAKHDIERNLFYINNRSAVGNGDHANKWRADIQLVQYFLADFFLKYYDLAKKLPPSRNPNAIVKIDGICGPRTIAGIRLFQECGRQILKVDGRVSIPRGISFLDNNSVGSCNWTIINMNTWWRIDGSGTELEKLEDDPLVSNFAPELMAELANEPVSVDW